MRSMALTRALTVVAAGVGVLFGIATVIAGGRVWFGSDPGYVVFRPLLIYNTTMGIAYVAAGITIARSLRYGRNAAGAIFVLNLFALVSIVIVYRAGGGVAVDSLQAMTLRTGIWFVLFAVVGWMARRESTA